MPSCAERVKWAEDNVTSKEGGRFSLEGRSWIVEKFWKPVDGWKIWPAEVEHLCDKCRPRVGEIVEAFSWKMIDNWARHALGTNGECAGLTLKPIVVTVLNLPRREGKTFNVCVFILSIIFLTMRRFVLLVAAAGDQTERLFEDNIEAVINQSDEMSDACEIRGPKVYVHDTGSRLEYARTTSHRSIAGGGFSHIVLEEARDLHPRIVAAAALSIRDQNGYTCPFDATHDNRRGVGPVLRKIKCKACGALLVPWFPRIIVSSSSGILEGGARDWFNELVELLEESCPANYFLFRMEESTNPVVSRDVSTALAEGLGALPSTRVYFDVELHNRARRVGDDFITKAELETISDRELVSLSGSELECVGYLDTSWSSDKTSIMIGGWDPDACAFPWQQLRVLHWRYWEPKKLPRKVIDPAAVQLHLDELVPSFPNLRMLLVDDRGMDWAKLLVITCNQERRGWGQKVKLFHGKRMRTKDLKTERAGARIPGIYGGEDDRSRAWQYLEQRIFLGRSSILIPYERELHAELLGVTKVPLPDGNYEIRDRDRRKRHADLADCLAGLCLLAELVKTNQRSKLDGKYSASRNPALASLSPSRLFGGGGSSSGGFGI